MQTGSIDELLTTLGRKEYAQTFTELAKQAPTQLHYKNQTYTLSNGTYTQTTTTNAPVEEWKTLLLTVQAPTKGELCIGLVLPQDTRYDNKQLAQAIGVSNKSIKKSKPLQELPLHQKPGSIGPWIPEEYKKIDFLLFDQASYEHAHKKHTGWTLPGIPDARIHVQGITPVYQTAAKSVPTHKAILQ